MFTTAYVINLDRDTQRWTTVENEIKRSFPSHVELVRVSAADGSNPSTRSDPDWNKVASGMCKYVCSAAQISCALSHLKVWEKVIDSNEPMALICEDDVSFRGEPHTELRKNFDQVPKDFDLLYLGCNECDYDAKKHTAWGALLHMLSNGSTSKQRRLSDNVYVPHVVFGSHCYVISRQGAMKMSALLRTGLNFHIDYMINTKRKELNIYAFHPKLAYQQCVLSVSSIATGKHPSGVNRVLDKLVDTDGTSWAYKLSVPVFSLGSYNVNAWTGIVVMLGWLTGKAGVREKQILVVIYSVLFLPDFVYADAVSINTVGNLVLFHLALAGSKLGQ